MNPASANTTRRFCALAALSLLFVFSAAAQDKPAAPIVYAITHAKLITLAGSPIEDGTVIIKEGKIAAIGAGVEVPAGAQVIDAKGLQVYPGLFDPITQMGLSEIGAVASTVDTSETGQINPDVVAVTAVFPSSEHIPVTRAAGITEALTVPGSGGFDSFGGRGLLAGQASAIHMAGWTTEEMQIKRSVAMVINWPTINTESFDFSTFSRKQKPFSEAKTDYEKQVTQLTEVLDSARHYAQAMGHGGPSDFERDVKLESLVPVVRGQLPVLVFADRARDIRNAVEYCDKHKLRMILAGGEEAYKVKDLLRSKDVPVILRPVLTDVGEEDDPYDRLLSQPAELVAAGVKIAFASFDNSFARRLGQNAANAIAHGLSPEDGLKAVTIYPAQIFGLSDQFGTLQVGKAANLIVTNGDPLELTTDVKYLFIRGELTSLENRHHRLYEKYLNRPKSEACQCAVPEMPNKLKDNAKPSGMLSNPKPN